jgi:hypothetical protein
VAGSITPVETAGIPSYLLGEPPDILDMPVVDDHADAGYSALGSRFDDPAR